MEIIGKIIHDLGEQSGTSKAGNQWKKHEYVLETIENFPKKVHFDFFGERADLFVLRAGDVIKLSFDIESREYNGRWYTSIRGFKSEPAMGMTPGMAPGMAAPAQAAPYTAPAPAAYPAPAPATAPAAAPAFGSDSTEDLPF